MGSMMRDLISSEQWISYIQKVATTSDLLLQTWRLDKDPFRHVAKLCRPYCDQFGGGKTVADFAGGTGQFSFLYSQLYPFTNCISINKFDPRDALPNLHLPEKVELVQQDLDDPYITKQPVDVAFFNYALGHFEDPTTVLQSIYDSLVPGGRLVMWDITPATPIFQKFYGYVLRPLAEVIQLIQSRNFKVLQCGVANAVMADSCSIFSAEERRNFEKHTLPFLLVAEKM